MLKIEISHELRKKLRDEVAAELNQQVDEDSSYLDGIQSETLIEKLSGSSYGRHYVLSTKGLKAEEILWLSEKLKPYAVEDSDEEGVNRGTLTQLSSLALALKDPLKKKIGFLKNFPEILDGFVRRCRKNLDDLGYPDAPLFVRDEPEGEFQPIDILPGEASYTPPSPRDESPERANFTYHILIPVADPKRADGVSFKDSTVSNTVRSHDIRGMSILEYLTHCGITLNTPELIEKQAKVVDYWLDLYNKYMYDKVVLDPSVSVASSGRGYRSYDDNNREKASIYYTGHAVLDYQTDRGGRVTKIQLPRATHLRLLPILNVFSLDSLDMVNGIHVRDITPYTYDSKIQERIILPEEHKLLLDVLSQDLSKIRQDVVSNKNSATAILMLGEPGVGKTLTAEVYAEMRKRPLLKITAASLGTEPGTIKRGMLDYMSRVRRWEAPMLIDEAEVMIRARGFDLVQSAICTMYLEALEYLPVTLFMTSNRGFEIDDAILSRCIAIIHYHRLTGENNARLWKLLMEQFCPVVAKDKTLLQQTIDSYPKATGRDIKMLGTLIQHYIDSGQEINIDLIRTLGSFRNLEFKATAEEEYRKQHSKLSLGEEIAQALTQSLGPILQKNQG